jgi:predicted metal-dependent hydrolase
MLKNRRGQLHGIFSAEINLDGQIIPYTVSKSRSARYARLKISAEHGLSIILPQHYPASYAEEVIRGKQRWVKKKLATIQRSRQIYADTSHVQYLGHTLNIHTYSTTHSHATAQLIDEELVVDLPESTSEVRPIVVAWLKSRAQSIIPPLVEQHGQHMETKYSTVRLRTARTRWGSCSPRGTLNFNWKLIMVPLEVIEYVIVHELCHLREMNHSPAFWKLVDQHCPNWRAHRRWLRLNESALAY